MSDERAVLTAAEVDSYREFVGAKPLCDSHELLRKQAEDAERQRDTEISRAAAMRATLGVCEDCNGEGLVLVHDNARELSNDPAAGTEPEMCRLCFGTGTRVRSLSACGVGHHRWHLVKHGPTPEESIYRCVDCDARDPEGDSCPSSDEFAKRRIAKQSAALDATEQALKPLRGKSQWFVDVEEGCDVVIHVPVTAVRAIDAALAQLAAARKGGE